MIDWDKVNRWRDYAGYYQIVTSELEMGDLEIISTYRELTQIENRFRTMKGTLDTRPIYVRTPEHINAHLTICVIALIIMALMQVKVKKAELVEAHKGQKWFLGLTPDRIQDALNAWEVEPMPSNYLRFRSWMHDKQGMDLNKLLEAHGIALEPRLYTTGEIRTLRGSFTVL